mmetsp:Transcript_5347/g.21042  ORF Transcript_5347/g.21042 Transcript_5347/m.21042 type:complete len:716 (-) Transcript_5347:631-2778(-)
MRRPCTIRWYVCRLHVSVCARVLAPRPRVGLRPDGGRCEEASVRLSEEEVWVAATSALSALGPIGAQASQGRDEAARLRLRRLRRHDFVESTGEGARLLDALLDESARARPVEREDFVGQTGSRALLAHHPHKNACPAPSRHRINHTGPPPFAGGKILAARPAVVAGPELRALACAGLGLRGSRRRAVGRERRLVRVGDAQARRLPRPVHGRRASSRGLGQQRLAVVSPVLAGAPIVLLLLLDGRCSSPRGPRWRARDRLGRRRQGLLRRSWCGPAREGVPLLRRRRGRRGGRGPGGLAGRGCEVAEATTRTDVNVIAAGEHDAGAVLEHPAIDARRHRCEAGLGCLFHAHLGDHLRHLACLDAHHHARVQLEWEALDHEVKVLRPPLAEMHGALAEQADRLACDLGARDVLVALHGAVVPARLERVEDALAAQALERAIVRKPPHAIGHARHVVALDARDAPQQAQRVARHLAQIAKVGRAHKGGGPGVVVCRAHGLARAETPARQPHLLRAAEVVALRAHVSLPARQQVIPRQRRLAAVEATVVLLHAVGAQEVLGRVGAGRGYGLVRVGALEVERALAQLALQHRPALEAAAANRAVVHAVVRVRLLGGGAGGRRRGRAGGLRGSAPGALLLDAAVVVAAIPTGVVRRARSSLGGGALAGSARGLLTPIVSRGGAPPLLHGHAALAPQLPRAYALRLARVLVELDGDGLPAV